MRHTEPNDLVVAVIYHSGLRKFAADRSLLHSVFLDVKQKSPKLFAVMDFVYDGLFPHSEQLECSLSDLERQGILIKKEDYFEVSKAIDDLHKKAIERITESKSYCCPYCIWATGLEFRKQLGADHGKNTR